MYINNFSFINLPLPRTKTMHADLLDVFYILCLPEDKLKKYIESIQLNQCHIISPENTVDSPENEDTERQLLFSLFIEIFESLYFDYDNLNDYAQDLIGEMLFLFETVNNVYLSPNIFREISLKILSLLNIELKPPQKSYKKLLNEYDFQIIQPSYQDLLTECKKFYPFEVLIENHETGKNLPITAKEKQIYGGFSKEISKQLEDMLNNFINDLIKLENQPYDQKLQCVKNLNHQLDAFNQAFRKENGYELFCYNGMSEMSETVFMITDTAGVKKEDYWGLLSVFS